MIMNTYEFKEGDIVHWNGVRIPWLEPDIMEYYKCPLTIRNRDGDLVVYRNNTVQDVFHYMVIESKYFSLLSFQDSDYEYI